MMLLADLHRAVQATVASKRLGTPVFVRYLFQSQDKAGAVLTRLAQSAGAISAWLGQPVERIYAMGQVKNRQISLTMELRGGATAVVGWSAGAPRGADLLVLGNHGALYHDAGSADLWDEALRNPKDKPNEALLTLIERALRSGRPEAAPK